MNAINSSRLGDCHISVNSTMIGSDDGLSSVWYQVIIWTIGGLFLIGHLANFNEGWRKNQVLFIQET